MVVVVVLPVPPPVPEETEEEGYGTFIDRVSAIIGLMGGGTWNTLSPPPPPRTVPVEGAVDDTV